MDLFFQTKYKIIRNINYLLLCFADNLSVVTSDFSKLNDVPESITISKRNQLAKEPYPLARAALCSATWRQNEWSMNAVHCSSKGPKELIEANSFRFVD